MSENYDDKTRTYVPLTNGTMVSHYRIIERIGAGGMGEVYLAEDTELNRKVALKFLPVHLCQDADCRARFKREAQAAAKLDHPNIVAVHEVSEFQRRPFFSMQHVEGQSLKEVIAGKTLPLDRILQIGIQVCDGLQAAHESGITHRDIKPSNILIDSHGRARIVDFGLASVMGSDHLTKTGSTLGTVGYMSPEQVRGEHVDHRTDLFSFGVVLYEMITGHAPFKADSDAATLHAITETKPELLARYRREIPTALQTIIDKALEKDVATRYHHADDFATDLKRLTSHTETHPAPKFSKRRMAWSSLVVVGVIAGSLVLKPWRIVIKPSEEAIAATKCVVIVPFKNQTGDPSLESLGKMVADWTTQSLMQTGLAEVVPPEMLPAFDAGAGLKPFVEATRADIFVTGSYYRIGDSIQFQAQIVNTDGRLLQGLDPIFTPSEKVMEGAEAVRQKVLGALAMVLDERLLGTAARASRPPNFDAYQEYVRGQGSHNERDWTIALGHFLRAHELDTQFLAPLIGACAACVNSGKPATLDSVVKFLKVRRAQLTGLQQLSLDSYAADLSGDLLKGLEAMRKGAQLAPGSGYAYNWGWRAYNLNRPRECKVALKSVNPDKGWMRGWMAYWTYLIAANHALGDYDEELTVIQNGRERYPNDAGLVYREIGAHAAKGEVSEIRKRIDLSDAIIRGNDDNLGAVMTSAAEELRAHGHETDAMTMLDSAIRWYESQSPEMLDSLQGGYGTTVYLARRWSSSELVFQKLCERFPGDSSPGLDYRAYLGWIAARKGDRKKAMEVFDWIAKLRTPQMSGEFTYWQACIAAILGDKEQAVALLKEAFEKGFPFSLRIHRDIDLESLWDFPPFIELMKPKG